MGLLKFGLLTLKNNTKQFILYLASITFSVTLIIINFNLLFNDSIYENTSDNAVMGLMVAIGAITFVSFANSYFLKLRAKEMAILMVSGKSEYDVCAIIFYENFFLFLFGSLIALAITGILSPLFMPKLFEYMNLANASYFTLSSIGYTIFVLIMIFVQLLLINLGYFIRKEPREIILETKNTKITFNNKFKLSYIVYILLISTPFYVVLSDFSDGDKGMFLSVTSLAYALGSYGLIKYVIPCLITKFKRIFFMKNKVVFMALSNLCVMQNSLVNLVVSLISTTAITLYIYSFQTSDLVFEVCTIIAYLIILIAVYFSIMFKLIGDAFSKVKSYKQLTLIGFKKSDINKIISLEIVLNYALVLLVTALPTFLTCSYNLKSGNYSSLLGNFIIISSLAIPFISMIITYISYKKIVLKKL